MAKLAKNSLTAGLALLIVFFFTSCAEDEQPALRIPPGNSLYVASAIIAPPAKTETEVNTRVAGDDVPVTVTVGSLGIFRSKGTGYTEALNNKKYTYTGADNGWQPATAGDTLFLNGDDAEVCAYYPYNGDTFFLNPEQILLGSGKYFGSGVANPSGSYEGTDICYATNRTVNAARRATTFEMKHALSLLEFRISKEAGYVGDCRITSISIMNPELILGSSINITNGTYDTTPAEGTITYNPGADADGILIESTAVTTGALLVPFTPTSEGLTIAFAVNGTSVEANIPTTNIAQLEAGHRYRVKVTMKAGAMEVTGVDMMPWDEVGVGGDDYTWYPVEEKVIDIGLGFVIAPGNLRATSTGYKFADDQGYYSGIDQAEYNSAGGDYFAWNTLDPAATASTNMTTVWDDTNDPCRKVKGGDWHTPTKEQLQKLADLYANNNAVWGTYGSGTKEGMYFGTADIAIAKANQDKYVFLPAAGNRFNTSWGSVGSEGFCWSSTPYFPDNSYLLQFGSNYCDVLYNGFINSYGFSVRCVKDKPKQKPEHAIEVKGLDFYVADGNVRAISNGADGYTYQFAEEQRYYSGDGSGGDYFCWNMLVPNIGKNDLEYDDALDPCHKIGDGLWYTPTKAQLEALNGTGCVWGTWENADGESVYGRYFGVTGVPDVSLRNSVVFLPAAGYIPDSNNVVGNSQVEGVYLSATNMGLTDPAVLWFNASKVVISTSWDGGYAGLDSKFPIRCVRSKE